MFASAAQEAESSPVRPAHALERHNEATFAESGCRSRDDFQVLHHHDASGHRLRVVHVYGLYFAADPLEV